MKNYLIPFLTERQIKVLADAGITCHLFDQAVSSYIVEGQNLAELLRLLKATAAEAPSQYQNIKLLNLTYSAVIEDALVNIEGTNVAVETNGSAMPKAKYFTLIEQVLSAKVSSKIILHLPPSREKAKLTRETYNDEFFHIHVFCSPAGKRRIRPPSKIFGVPVHCDRKGFGATGKGIAIVDSKNEYVVGEIFDNNLYIHHDLFNGSSSNKYKLLGAILEAALPDIGLSRSERTMRIKERQREDRQQSRQLYVEACSMRIRELLDAAKQQVGHNLAQIAPLQNKCLALYRVDAFAAQPNSPERSEQFKAELAAEYDRVSEVCGVKSVMCSKNLVMLKTEVLMAQHPDSGQYHEIGEFLIVINLEGGRSAIRWFNATRRIEGVRPGMNAPNVHADGTPCFNEIFETMIELIARLELAVVAELAIQFVQTATKDLPWSHLSKWPRTSSN